MSKVRLIPASVSPDGPAPAARTKAGHPSGLLTAGMMSYDGWLALPADVRERLGLSTGHQLELVGGAIVLRPTGAAGMDGGTRTWVRDTMAALPPSGGTMWQTMPPSSPRYDTSETVCRSPGPRA